MPGKHSYRRYVAHIFGCGDHGLKRQDGQVSLSIDSLSLACTPANMQKTGKKLDVIVIGAGLAGLSVAICLARHGHKVKVLERSAQLSEFGAGIQCGPNASRLIGSWELAADFQTRAFVPARSITRRYADNKILGITPQNPHAIDVYGSP